MERELNQILQNINKFITISDTDRGPYAADYIFVKNQVIKKMQELDPVFKKIYNGDYLGGSYADKIKISKPDEYDLVLHLKLKESTHIVIQKNKKLPGYCNINMIELMKKIQKEKQNRDLYDHFQNLITPDGYLIQDKVYSWFEGLMTKVIINEFKNELINNDKRYTLKYTKAGPAHTITVEQHNIKFSIDFVPGFLFDKTKWIAKRPIPLNTAKINENWIALPKPIKEVPSPNINFITSYVDTERNLFHNKNSFKNTLKMIKKIRDRRGLSNLKSYFIKTVYLWENEVQPDSFWNQPTHAVLIHMLQKLIIRLEENNLPFFWDQEQNMLQKLKPNQIVNIVKELKRAEVILTSNMSKIYDIFLTEEEKSQLLSKTKESSKLNIHEMFYFIDGNKNKNNKMQSVADQNLLAIENIIKKNKNNSEKALEEIKRLLITTEIKD